MSNEIKAKQRKLIQKLKRKVKHVEPFLEKCEEYQRDKDFVDDVKITFQPLDVSAKTLNGEVILNEKMLDDDFEDVMRYTVHELCHVLQQEAGKVSEKVDRDDYLDDENEQEAFDAQLQYMSDHETPEEIQAYLERLLDHHDITGKERVQKIRELTKNI